MQDLFKIIDLNSEGIAFNINRQLRELDEPCSYDILNLSLDTIVFNVNKAFKDYLKAGKLDFNDGYWIKQIEQHYDMSINLNTFIKVLKVFKKGYLEFCQTREMPNREAFQSIIHQFFDSFEIRIISYWETYGRIQVQDLLAKKHYILSLIELLPNPIIFLSEDFTINYSNSLIQSLYIGKENTLIEHLALIKKLMKGQNETSFEVTLSIDNSEKHYKIKAKKLFDINGKDEEIILIYNDITKVKIINKELELNQKKYFKLINNSNDAIYLHEFGPNGEILNFIEVNKIACESLGYSREELLEMSPVDIDANLRKNVDAMNSFKRISRFEKKAFETIHITKLGQQFPVEISSHYIEIGDKELVVSIAKDITERKKNEEHMRKSRDFYLSMLEEVPSLIWRTDSNGKCDYLNKSWLAFTGKTFEQEIGDGWTKGIHPEDLDKLLKLFGEAFRKKTSFEFEYKLRRYDGEYRLMISKGQPFYDLSGNFSGYLGFCFDITERKHTEKLLILGELSLEMVHEIKNPLTNIKGLIDLLEMEETIAGKIEIVDRLKATTIRVDNVLNNFLKFTRLKVNNFEPLDINNIIKEAADFLKPLLFKKQVKLITNLSERVLISNVDKFLLQQVIVNLVMNSLDAEGTKSIWITTEADITKNKNIIRVQDDGCGIESTHLNKIFDPFFTTKNAGSGLGLSIVSKIIGEFQGDISVKSNLNEGFTFSFEIPSCSI